MLLYLSLLAMVAMSQDDYDYSDFGECAVCDTEYNDYLNCALDKCTGTCVTGTDDECTNCIIDKCWGDMETMYICEYGAGCQIGDYCSSCSTEEAEFQLCYLKVGVDEKCGLSIDSDFNEADIEMECLVQECGGDTEALLGCDYTNCQTSSYDVWFTQSLCGDGSACDSDCTQISGMASTFGECVDEDGPSSWSVVCNADSTVTLSQYGSFSCSGPVITNDLTNGMCGNVEMDGTDLNYKYEWFGGCGGETYVAPSSTSTLFIVLAFVLSVVLY